MIDIVLVGILAVHIVVSLFEIAALKKVINIDTVNVNVKKSEKKSNQ